MFHRSRSSAASLAHEGVYAAAVVGVPEQQWGEAVTAYVVAENAGDEEIDHVISSLLIHYRASLAKHEIPKKIEIVSELPMTSTGKIQKHLLRNRVSA